MTDEITIRRAETLDDYRACQHAQKVAWGITDESYLIPLATMVGVQHHGGLVLGAFDASGAILGVSFAFLGRIHGRFCLYSQLTGVVPGQQGKGIGNRLKQYQREFARSEGLDSLAWSFDPLQAGNARFNLHHLGATSSRFIEDMYGRRTDALNADTPTDRLIAEWPAVPDPSPRPELPGIDDLPRLIRTRIDEAGSPIPEGAIPAADLGPVALLEIPADITSLRRDDPTRAAAWTSALRAAFPDAFARGYRAEGFHRDGDRGFYVLRR
ncbi:hypothetical protein TA3x_004522 [Tundrisphaera sp. TA3]|uniref:hypothetical protein n=1 Tax=Tundrisphaera sp. TA3 TaxID=3435775 RepID=UPI003EBE66CC